MYILKHLNTINRHRREVRRLCFRIGLYWQGITHDLSKYSPTEFLKGIIYYQGNKSPNNYEREINGYSLSWLHHKGRNKHHFEYWLDYDMNKKGAAGMRMPRKYIAEMFCDRIAACKIYEKEDYTKESPIRFFYRGFGRNLMHPETRREIGYLLTLLGDRGEDAAVVFIREKYLKGSEIPLSYIELKDIEEYELYASARTH